MAKHQKELERFAGKWIAILGEKVVAIGDNYELVWAEVKRKYPARRRGTHSIRGPI